MAHNLAQHASARQALVAQNVAHADTPGYRARDIRPFAETYSVAGAPLRVTRARHSQTVTQAPGWTRNETDRAGAAAPNGNTVSLETEMIHAAEVKRAHDMALAVYETSLGILRASLGRAR